jgi:hypothetical protein
VLQRIVCTTIGKQHRQDPMQIMHGAGSADP